MILYDIFEKLSLFFMITFAIDFMINGKINENPIKNKCKTLLILSSSYRE